jgi:hypothetical protein
MNERQLIEKIRRLPPDKQKEVFDFVEQAEKQVSTMKPRRRIEGALEHLGLHVSAEEIDEAAAKCGAIFPGMIFDE